MAILRDGLFADLWTAGCEFYDRCVSLLATASMVWSDIHSTQVFHHFPSHRARKAPIPPRELFFCLSTEPLIISYLVRHFGKYNL